MRCSSARPSARPACPPHRAPEPRPAFTDRKDGAYPMGRFVIVTPMKNEGPFIVEWVAHNLAIGVDEMAIFSNDCTDGSDALLDRLHEMGKLHHVDNSSRKPAPQRRAYRRFLKMDLAGPEDWVIPIDADEYINVKTGDHTLRALTDAVPQARTLSMTWRLFGNAGVRSYEDIFLTDQFRMAAADMTRRPPQAWGLKTMFRRDLWGHIGVHRPKRPTVETFAETQWFNGSGQPMPDRYMEAAGGRGRIRSAKTWCSPITKRSSRVNPTW